MKHGRASSVVITLEANEEGTVLKVADNGIGITYPHVVDSGMGLRIMRQRAKLIGGVFGIVSSPSEGTVISCFLPLRPDQEKEARRA